jgi:hypothetical protein
MHQRWSPLGADTSLRTRPACLRPWSGGASLTFHSGEDRRVKKAFAVPSIAPPIQASPAKVTPSADSGRASFQSALGFGEAALGATRPRSELSIAIGQLIVGSSPLESDDSCDGWLERNLVPAVRAAARSRKHLATPAGREPIFFASIGRQRLCGWSPIDELLGTKYWFYEEDACDQDREPFNVVCRGNAQTFCANRLL